MKIRKNQPEPKPKVEAAPIQRAALSVEEFAAAVGLGRTYVYKLIREGTLKSFKTGRRRLVPSTEMEAFLARMAGGEEC